MILEEQLLLQISLDRVGKPFQTLLCSAFNSHKEYSFYFLPFLEKIIYFIGDAENIIP